MADLNQIGLPSVIYSLLRGRGSVNEAEYFAAQAGFQPDPDENSFYANIIGWLWEQEFFASATGYAKVHGLSNVTDDLLVIEGGGSP